MDSFGAQTPKNMSFEIYELGISFHLYIFSSTFLNNISKISVYLSG
jgi:hypothetical protein